MSLATDGLPKREWFMAVSCDDCTHSRRQHLDDVMCEYPSCDCQRYTTIAIWKLPLVRKDQEGGEG